MTDAEKAVHILDLFTKTWCINHDYLRFDEPQFRCDRCEFAKDPYCLVHIFKNKHYSQYGDFGSMCDYGGVLLEMGDEDG